MVMTFPLRDYFLQSVNMVVDGLKPHENTSHAGGGMASGNVLNMHKEGYRPF
jgi:hypothetical protein